MLIQHGMKAVCTYSTAGSSVLHCSGFLRPPPPPPQTCTHTGPHRKLVSFTPTHPPSHPPPSPAHPAPNIVVVHHLLAIFSSCPDAVTACSQAEREWQAETCPETGKEGFLLARRLNVLKEGFLLAGRINVRKGRIPIGWKDKCPERKDSYWLEG